GRASTIAEGVVAVVFCLVFSVLLLGLFSTLSMGSSVFLSALSSTLSTCRSALRSILFSIFFSSFLPKPFNNWASAVSVLTNKHISMHPIVVNSFFMRVIFTCYILPIPLVQILQHHLGRSVDCRWFCLQW